MTRAFATGGRYGDGAVCALVLTLACGVPAKVPAEVAFILASGGEVTLNGAAPTVPFGSAARNLPQSLTFSQNLPGITPALLLQPPARLHLAAEAANIAAGDEPDDAAAPAGNAPTSVPRFETGLMVFPEAAQSLREQRDIFANRLAEASPEELPQILLDHAQQLIARMMLPEARGLVIAALRDLPGQDRIARARGEGYRSLIDYLGAPRGPRAAETLPAEWAGDPLWPTLLKLQHGALPAARLTAARAQAALQSPAIAAVLAMGLFEAALEAGEIAMAREITADAEALGARMEPDRLLLMRGLLALAERDDRTAFDFFAWAAEGRGRAAAEARLHIADLALGRRNPGLLPQVLDILKAGVPHWRGDALALRMRARLAQVAEELRDQETAIMVMADIIESFPASPEAVLADERIPLALTRIERRIARDSLSLEEGLALARRIGPRVAQRPEWVGLRLTLADKIAEAGLQQAAVAEYQVVWQELLALGASRIDPALQDRLVLHEARLLIGMGRPKAARIALDRRAAPHPAAPEADFALLRAQLDGAPQGGPENPGETVTPGDPELALARARHALEAGSEAAALAAYRAALGRAEGARESDHLQAMRLAAKLEKTLPTNETPVATGDLAGPALPVLTGLAARMPALAPVAEDLSRGMLETAAATTEAVDELLAAIE